MCHDAIIHHRITILAMGHRITGTAQDIGHRLIDMAEKLVPTGTEVIQTCLPFVGANEAVLRALPIAGKLVVTLLALAG